MLYARSRVVHAAASFGLDAIDVPWLDLEDMDGLREECRLVQALGFTGKATIHPKQLAVMNDVFTPDAERIAWAQAGDRGVRGRLGRPRGAGRQARRDPGGAQRQPTLAIARATGVA